MGNWGKGRKWWTGKTEDVCMALAAAAAAATCLFLEVKVKVSRLWSDGRMMEWLSHAVDMCLHMSQLLDIFWGEGDEEISRCT